MRLFSWKNNKIKILNITIFKLRHTSKGTYFYFLGVPFYKNMSATFRLVSEFKSNQDFDTQKFDEQIENLVRPFVPLDVKKDDKKIGVLATEICDNGGHTKCIRDLVSSLSENYEQILFLTQKSASVNNAPAALNIIKQHTAVYGIDADFIFFRKRCKRFCDKIISQNIKVLLVYIHPNDIFGTAVLAYLKNTTDIKIIYFNHASHYPNLGMSFANVILECMPTTEKITHERRHLNNTSVIGLQSLRKDETVYYSGTELKDLREKLGVKPDEFITMSGGASYKFFDDNNNSAYFKMIKILLKKEPKLKHIIIAEFSNEYKSVIDNIFSGQEQLKNRIIFVPYQTNFDKWFQIADVFIDSFPVSSALTQIDLMRNKVASVVKINKDNPEFSFHEYQMPDYPYMFEKVDDMENAVLELLHNKAKRQEIIKKNYDFWLKTYESGIVRDKYIKIIEET